MKTSTVRLILVPLVATLAKCSAAAAADDLQEVPGILLSIVTTATYPDIPCDGTRTSACTSCTQFKVCVSSDVAMDTANPREECPKAAPFCSMSSTENGAVCQASLDTFVMECANAKPTFKCVGYGYYPDAYSCQVYYYCAGPGATPEVYNCPPGYVMSTTTKACAPQVRACPTFTCNDTWSTMYQALPYAQYYAFCEYDRTVTPAKLKETWVFSCGDGATFNPATDQCVFKCTKEGLYPKTSSSKHYYQCYLSGGKLTAKERTCRANEVFGAQRCIPLPFKVPK